MLNKRYNKSIKQDIFVLISFPVFLFQFLFCYILERKDKKWFKCDIIVLTSYLILLVSISFLVNIGKEMSLPGFRRCMPSFFLYISGSSYVAAPDGSRTPVSYHSNFFDKRSLSFIRTPEHHFIRSL